MVVVQARANANMPFREGVRDKGMNLQNNIMLHVGWNGSDIMWDIGSGAVARTPIWTSRCQAILPFMEGAGGRHEPRFPGRPAMPRAAVVLVVPRGSRAVAQRRVDGI